MIEIYLNDSRYAECESVVVIPEKAIEEPGYIAVHTINDSAHAKHEYHAMAQMAYYQYQDDELDLQEITQPITIVTPLERVEMESGLVLYRLQDGSFFGAIHQFLSKKKLLEAGYRYCARWIRLDI